MLPRLVEGAEKRMFAILRHGSIFSSIRHGSRPTECSFDLKMDIFTGFLE
jgi:hypothetical protein